jgi:glutamate dehydrogenase
VDHSGCAEDPDGLNHDELLRLVNSALCISYFDATKLGSSRKLHTTETPEGTKARNTMHNRLQADAFLPCGGLPNANAIDCSSYNNFILADGLPLAPLTVEGANLFITKDARKSIF